MLLERDKTVSARNDSEQVGRSENPENHKHNHRSKGGPGHQGEATGEKEGQESCHDRGTTSATEDRRANRLADAIFMVSAANAVEQVDPQRAQACGNQPGH